MLKKDNRYRILKIFFENPLPNGIGFQLREISRNTGIAPLSVKKYLVELEKEGLVLVKRHRIHNYPVYYTNRDNENFRFLKKLDNISSIKESGLLDYIDDNLTPEAVVLFGSAARGEDTEESDLDLFVFSKEKKVELGRYEKILKRKINIFFSDNFIKLSPQLKNNILNGIILKGYLKVF